MQRSWTHLSLIAAASILFVGLLFTPSAQAYRGCYTTGCCAFIAAGSGPDSCGNPGCGQWGNCACVNCGDFTFTDLCSNGTLYCN
jgi:hypothetical protein